VIRGCLRGGSIWIRYRTSAGSGFTRSFPGSDADLSAPLNVSRGEVGQGHGRPLRLRRNSAPRGHGSASCSVERVPTHVRDEPRPVISVRVAKPGFLSHFKWPFRPSPGRGTSTRSLGRRNPCRGLSRRVGLWGLLKCFAGRREGQRKVGATRAACRKHSGPLTCGRMRASGLVTRLAHHPTKCRTSAHGSGRCAHGTRRGDGVGGVDLDSVSMDWLAAGMERLTAGGLERRGCRPLLLIG
jgi:hypothetical protein